MEINDRKKAKQAYLESLAKQKASNQTAVGPEINAVSSSPFPDEVAKGQAKQSRREQLLEEKRRAFFEQQQNGGQSGGSMTEISSVIHAAPKSIKSDLFAPTGPQPFQPSQLNSFHGNPEAASSSRMAVVDTKPSLLEEPTLSDWKRLGYPSEYAYAKDLGMLAEKKLQSSVQPSSGLSHPTSSLIPTFNVPTMDGQAAFGNASKPSFPSITLPSMPLPLNVASAYGGYGGVGGMGVGGNQPSSSIPPIQNLPLHNNLLNYYF
ncbi:hypothetical protein EON65_58475, partial [archaeon]